MMKEVTAKKEIRHVSEIDYPILCEKFGEAMAIRIMLLARARNVENAIRTGATIGLKDKDC